MATPQTQYAARKRWTEIVAEIETSRDTLQREIEELRAEKDRLSASVKLTKAKAGKIDLLVSESEKALNDAKTAATSALESDAKINKIAGEATKLQQDTESIHSKSKENSRTIESLLDSADKAALSGNFNSYANSYRWRADIYTACVVAVVVSFVVILLRFQLLDLPSNPSLLTVLAYGVRKVAIAVPFAYLVYLFTSLQNEARKLERYYRFKTAIALSLKANKELISDLYTKEHLVKDGDRSTYPVAEFAVGVVKDNIYVMPDEMIPVAQAANSEAPDLSFFATQQTKRALNLLKEFSEIIKNIKP